MSQPPRRLLALVMQLEVKGIVEKKQTFLSV